MLQRFMIASALTLILSLVGSVRADMPEPLFPRVMQIAYNPILENQGGLRVNAWAGWGHPGTLRLQYVADMKEATSNLVQFRVDRFIHSDVFPVKRDGFRYDDASYVTAATGGAWHQPDGVDYLAIARNHDLARRVDRGEIDEVFIDGAPYFGYWESTMGGLGGYWCNSSPQQRIASSRIFVMMGFNYERGVAEMLHSCGHRSESIMEHTYGFWNITLARHDWERFTHNIGQSPDAACGSVHYPPNGVADYDYANVSSVVSTAIDWQLNFPDLTGQTSMVSRATWGGPDYHRGFMKWWYAHMPHLAGRNNHDGFDRLNNWYAYIFDLNRYPESGGNHVPGGTPPAAEPNPTAPVRLTVDSNDAWAPKINAAGRVVWHGSDGSDYEIYAADQDGENLIRITTNALSDEDPQINAVGQIVWQVFDGADYEIFTADASGGNVRQITNNTVNDWHPQINDSGRIVWDAFDGGDYEIYSANIDGSDLIQITNNAAASGLPREDVWPQINNAGRVVWFGYDGGDWEIFSANDDGTDLVNVSNDYREDVYPQINASGQLVWFRYDSNSNTEIMTGDAAGGPTVRVTNNAYHDWHPQINDSGTVVWMARPVLNWEVYSANHDGTQVTLVSDNAEHDQYPQIDAGGRIVWQGFDGTDWEIYALEDGTVYQLTDNDYDDRWPAIAGEALVAWHGEAATTALGATSSEIFTAPIGQLFADIDEDGLPDVWEMLYFEDLLRVAGGDEEPDGLINADEYAYGTDPTNADTDTDGLADGYEVHSFGSDPLDTDTDDDDLADAAEDAAGTNPRLADTDEDDMGDAWEVAYGTDPLIDDAAADPDADGFDNLTEHDAGTDPRAPWSIPLPAAGAALAFDGIDDLVNLGNVAVAGNTLTVEAWVKPNKVATARIAEKLEDYGVHLGATNQVRFMTKSGITWDILDGTVAVNADAWTHVACVLDGSSKRIMLNGVEDVSRGYSQSLKVTGNNLIVGAASPAGGQGFLDGAIDEIRIWNVAHTASEIAAAMNTPLVGDEPGLIAYWRFDEAAGQDVADSAAAFDGTRGMTAAAGTDDPAWIVSPIAPRPDAGQGAQISGVAHPASAGVNQPFEVSAVIDDSANGDDGVASSTLYYGYDFPYNASVVAGVEGVGGVWTFAIAAQGEAQRGRTLRFFIRADDGAGNPSFDSNDGDPYRVAIGMPGDWDGDGDVDAADFVEMPPCLAGPDVIPAGVNCGVFDADGDGDVDLADFARVTQVFTGP